MQKESYRKQVKRIHKRKLNDLGLHLPNTPEFDIVRNFSNRKLTDSELKVLNRGLKFGIFPQRINLLNIQAEFESLYQQIRFYLNSKDRLETKVKLISLYKRYKSAFFYDKKTEKYSLPSAELKALESLIQGNSLVICKLDKDNGVVALNKSNYLQKMNQILNNKNKFRKVFKDTNIDNLST